MSLIRVGTNKEYSEGWEMAFGRAKKKAAAAKPKTGKPLTQAKAPVVKAPVVKKKSKR